MLLVWFRLDQLSWAIFATATSRFRAGQLADFVLAFACMLRGGVRRANNIRHAALRDIAFKVHAYRLTLAHFQLRLVHVFQRSHGSAALGL